MGSEKARKPAECRNDAGEHIAWIKQDRIGFNPDNLNPREARRLAEYLDNAAAWIEQKERGDG